MKKLSKKLLCFVMVVAVLVTSVMSFSAFAVNEITIIPPDSVQADAAGFNGSVTIEYGAAAAEASGSITFAASYSCVATNAEGEAHTSDGSSITPGEDGKISVSEVTEDEKAVARACLGDGLTFKRLVTITPKVTIDDLGGYASATIANAGGTLVEGWDMALGSSKTVTDSADGPSANLLIPYGSTAGSTTVTTSVTWNEDIEQ